MMHPPVPRIEIKGNADDEPAIFVYPNIGNVFEIPFKGGYEHVGEIELGQTGLDLQRDLSPEVLDDL
ncbi:MAG TPA: hypothetical protein VFK97_00495, partial [Candidatus Saccharimonadales bacterium]|nr:hypothetical protein [Candidatus Saccharimonadales bacterium]